MPKSTNVYHNVSSKISSGTHIPSSLNINILSPPETKKHDFQNKIFYKIFIKGDRGGCRMAGAGYSIEFRFDFTFILQKKHDLIILGR